MSMSGVRTHFCTLVARAYGAGASPRKYGLNCTMPALTSSSVGSSATTDADGTTVCPRDSKKRRKRSRISAEFMGPSSSFVLIDAECLPQLRLALGGVVLHLAPPQREPVAD